MQAQCTELNAIRQEEHYLKVDTLTHELGTRCSNVKVHPQPRVDLMGPC